MELKHDETKTEMMNGNKPKMRLGVAVLAAGLSFMPGCAKNEQPSMPHNSINSPMKAPKAIGGDSSQQNAREVVDLVVNECRGNMECIEKKMMELNTSGSGYAKGCEFVLHAVPSVNIISYPKGRCKVHEGDSVFNIEFILEKAGFFGWNVSKIDDLGIELVMSSEIFMSEHASSKNDPLRINYGENKPLALRRVVLATEAISVKAEKGDTPGTAFVTVDFPAPDGGYTEMKRTSGAKMSKP